VGIFKKGGARMVLVKLSLEELELLIEVMERNRIDNDNENTLRHDLRSIREQVENEKNRLAKEMAKRPKEEMRLIPNPTSAEHIE
jgi:predicted phage gp36 major capsid-like protein|tara:strand:- start:1342 stop:1596 length:255 start_codon:yes stop_codon:yes gene_type:complete